MISKRSPLIYTVFALLLFQLAFIQNAWGSPKLSPFLQKQFVKARTLLETESWAEAKTYLTELAQNTENKSAQALSAQSLGQIAIYQDDLVGALKQFSRAHDLQVLDEAVNNRLLHSIAQLHCAIDEWQACREKLQQWMLLSPAQVKGSDYMMIAQAFAATEAWSPVIDPVRKAIAMEERAPLGWHRLEVAAWSHMEEWSNAIVAQKRLLSAYADNVSEWRRLVSLQLQLDDFSGALGSMRVPFEKRWLTREEDYRRMAQLLFHEGIPFRAGEVLAQGIDEGYVPKSAENLRRLGNIWSHAKEFSRAIPVFEALLEIEPKREFYKQLAVIHFQQKQWREASQTLRKTLVDNTDAKLKLMLAIALTNMEAFREARVILVRLTTDETVRSSARNWLGYLDALKV